MSRNKKNKKNNKTQNQKEEKEKIMQETATKLMETIHLNPPILKCSLVKCKIKKEIKPSGDMTLIFLMSTEYGDIKKIKRNININTIATNNNINENVNNILNVVYEITNMPQFSLLINPFTRYSLENKIRDIFNQEANINIPDNMLKLTKYEDFLKMFNDFKKNNILPNLKFEDSYISKDNMLSFKIYNLKFNYDINKEELYSDDFDYLKRTENFFKKNKEELSKAIDFINNNITNAIVSIEIKKTILKITCAFTKGTLKGKIKFSNIEMDNFSFEGFKACLNNLKSISEKEIFEKKERAVEDLYNLPVYGDLLATSILQFVELNASAYPNSDAICRNLRGSTHTFRNPLINSKCSGKFKILTAIEIEDMIQELINLGLLKVYKYKVSKTVYEGLNISQKGVEFLKLPYKFNILKDYEDYSDKDWLEFLKTEPHEYNEQQMSILDKKNLAVLYFNKVQDFLKDKPESWFDYINMMWEIEDTIGKRYWKLLKMAIPSQYKEDN